MVLVHVTVQFPVELVKAMDHLAGRTRQGRSELVRIAVREYLEASMSVTRGACEYTPVPGEKDGPLISFWIPALHQKALERVVFNNGDDNTSALVRHVVRSFLTREHAFVLQLEAFTRGNMPSNTVDMRRVKNKSLVSNIV